MWGRDKTGAQRDSGPGLSRWVGAVPPPEGEGAALRDSTDLLSPSCPQDVGSRLRLRAKIKLEAKGASPG